MEAKVTAMAVSELFIWRAQRLWPNLTMALLEAKVLQNDSLSVILLEVDHFGDSLNLIC